jgi:CBS domain-containing protein
MSYKIIEIFTREEVRWHGSPLYEAIVQAVAREKSAARCIVTRGVAGCFENGEVATHRILDISYNMPVKIEIILPPAELERVLPRIEEMVTDGIVVVEESEVLLHRTTGELLPRSLRVRDVMTVRPVAAKPADAVIKVLGVLIESEFDSVPVVDDRGQLVGMVSQEDLVQKTGLHAAPSILAALSRGSGSPPPGNEVFSAGTIELTAGDVLSRKVKTISSDDLLVDAVRTMTGDNLKRLPVLDQDGRLVGMLSRIDILRVASAGISRREAWERYGASVPGTTPVGEANLLDAPTVSPEATAREALDLLDREIRRVVVVDPGGAPLGAISDRDLLPLLDSRAKMKIDELKVTSIMRTVPVISRETTIEDALRWMVENRRQRLPVVDADGRYVGMLSREELLRILASP